MRESAKIMKYAAIFDWDGVVVDSGNEHMKSWELLAAKHGFELPENYFISTFGKRNLEIIPHIFKWTSDIGEARRLSDEKEVFYRQIVKERGLPTIAGVREFFEKLNAAGILCAVGSSTPRENLLQALDKLDMAKYFKDFAAMEDVKNGKPAPDVFLCAAKKLGADPKYCAVFEDSEAGIDAATAANMKRVAVATTHPRAFWQNKTPRPDLIIEDFKGTEIADFMKLFA